MKGGKRNMKKLFGAFVLASVLLTIGFASAVTFESDANTQYSDDDGVSWQDSVVIASPNSAWKTITGGAWIWSSDPVSDNSAKYGEELLFKESFSLEECQQGYHPTGYIEVSADNTYKLYLNGELIGSELGQYTYKDKEGYILNTALQYGENVLEIEATNMGFENLNPASNPAGIIYVGEAICETDDFNVPEFGTVIGILTVIGALGVFFVVRRH